MKSFGFYFFFMFRLPCALKTEVKNIFHLFALGDKHRLSVQFSLGLGVAITQIRRLAEVTSTMNPVLCVGTDQMDLT